MVRAESTLPKCEGSDFNWTNCFGTTDYQVGDQYGIYEGEWKDGERHGQGTYDDSAGSIYIGEWKHDERSGEGIQIYPDGSKYEGQWENDQRSGQGILILSDGEKYDGEWKDNKRHGLGTVTYLDGSSEYGLWVNNKREKIMTKKNYELLIPILLVVAITVLLKLFVKKFYNYLIVPIKKGLLLSNSMKGNASRTEYNIYCLFIFLFLAFSMYCLFVISNFFPHLEMFGVYIFWYFVYAIFAFISGLAVTLRRFNDLQMSRSTIIFLFIPIINLFFAVYLCITPSVAKNKFIIGMKRKIIVDLLI
jgi:uncharacterized membrane protein YhaH (DUF805 family)